MNVDRSQIVLDACCILNFCASGYFLEILQTIPARVVVTEVVRERELLTLQYLENEENEGAIQFETAIDRGLLTIVDFESEEEAETFVNYAAILGDDGESATGAIAICRDWSIATDDKRAISFFKQEAPHLQILSTLEIVQYWSQNANVSTSVLRDVLKNIQFHGSYIPPKSHPLRAWWEESTQ